MLHRSPANNGKKKTYNLDAVYRCFTVFNKQGYTLESGNPLYRPLTALTHLFCAKALNTVHKQKTQQKQHYRVILLTGKPTVDIQYYDK